ncbi:MAG: CopD family protein [Acidimicrobiales bacterium]
MIGAQAVSVSANWSDVVDPGAWWDVAATHSGRWWAARLLVLAAVAVSGALVGSAVRERNGDIGAAFAEPDGAAGLAVELDGVRGLAVEPDGVAGTAAGSAGLRGPGRALWVHAAAAVAAVGLALITALGGHAVSGRWVVLGFVATVAHLLALGFWVTGLMALLSAGRGGRHGRRRGHGRNAAGGGLIAASEVAFATAFSPWALGAVAVVVATGAFNSVRQVGERSLLSSTDYGTVLVTKVLLVAGLIGVAALSRRTLHRACGTATGNVTGAEAEQVIGGQRSAGAGHGVGGVGVGGVGGGAGEWGSESGVLRRTVVLEVVLFAVVLVAGAVLVNVRPSYSERSGPSSGSATVGQRLAQVVLEPARAGSNELHVYLSSPGGALDRADSITVTATLAEADVGPIDIDVFPAGPNHVTNPSANLPLKGRWSFEVIARFGRFEEVRFTVPLAVSS